MTLYPDYGCWTWFAPNALADEWLSKIKLKKIHWAGQSTYSVVGLPCWTYTWTCGGKHWLEPDATMNTFNDKDCWCGVCTQHAIVHTAILQERVKGGWNVIDGVSLKAVMIGLKNHWTTEVYIKDVGYFILDVLEHPRLYQGKVKARIMMNRHLCTGAYTDKSIWGSVPYNPEWAGPDTRTYIKATTTPSGARIWLKKH